MALNELDSSPLPEVDDTAALSNLMNDLRHLGTYIQSYDYKYFNRTDQEAHRRTKTVASSLAEEVWSARVKLSQKEKNQAGDSTPIPTFTPREQLLLDTSTEVVENLKEDERGRLTPQQVLASTQIELEILAKNPKNVGENQSLKRFIFHAFSVSVRFHPQVGA